MAFKIMKEKGITRVAWEQVDRMMRTRLYGADMALDEQARIRMDDWELREDVQQTCRDLWPSITTENLSELTDYTGYKQEFLRLFGFGLDEVDYDHGRESDVQFGDGRAVSRSPAQTGPCGALFLQQTQPVASGLLSAITF